MTPDVAEMDEFIVVGIRTVLEPGAAMSTQVWTEQFLPRRGEIEAISKGKNEFYWVFCPLPGDKQGRYEYVAGVKTDSLECIPTGMVGWIVPPGNYALMDTSGIDGVYTTYRNVVTDWLPDSGYKKMQTPMFAVTTSQNPGASDAVWRVGVPIETPETLAQLETWFS